MYHIKREMSKVGDRERDRERERGREGERERESDRGRERWLNNGRDNSDGNRGRGREGVEQASDEQSAGKTWMLCLGPGARSQDPGGRWVEGPTGRAHSSLLGRELGEAAGMALIALVPSDTQGASVTEHG